MTYEYNPSEKSLSDYELPSNNNQNIVLHSSPTLTAKVLRTDSSFDKLTSIDESLNDQIHSINDEKNFHLEIDSIWSYIILLAAFFVNFATIALEYTFGVFQVLSSYILLLEFYVRHFNTSNFYVSIIGSVYCGTWSIYGAFTDYVIQRLGNQKTIIFGGMLLLVGQVAASFCNEVYQLAIFQGIVVAVGSATAFYAAVDCVGEYFDKKLGIAIGIMTSGAGIVNPHFILYSLGLGSFVIAPLYEALISIFDFPWALRIIGLLLSIICFCCSIVLKQQLPSRPRHEIHIVEFSLLKDNVFFWLFWHSIIFVFSYYIPFNFLSSFVVTFGFTPSFGALAIGIMNLSSAIGRFITGLLSDYFNCLILWVFLSFLCTLITFLWLLLKTKATIIIFSIVFGLAIGGWITIQPAALAKLFGSSKMAAALGLLWTASTPGSIFGSMIHGAILDITGSWLIFTFVCGSFYLIGTLLLMPIFFVKPNYSSISPSKESLWSSSTSVLSIKDHDDNNTDIS